jgi:hypothetical protein
MSTPSGSEQVWLSREGKTEGPFTATQIEALKTSGEYTKYTWIWSAKSKNWEPIYPAPPPPSLPKKKEAVENVARNISAICHDNRQVVGGTIDSKIGADSIFKSTQHGDQLPPFKKRAKILVNLLDENSGDTENAQAEIVDFKKSGSTWEYRLKWQTAPKMIPA